MADNFQQNYQEADKKCNELNVLLSEFDSACKNNKGQKTILYKMKANVKSLDVLMKTIEKTKYQYEDQPSNYPNISKKERESRIQRMEKLIATYNTAKSAFEYALNRDTNGPPVSSVVQPEYSNERDPESGEFIGPGGT